jgi:hypothetical protein
MDDRTVIHNLLYRAFLDIRIAAYEKKSHEGIFKIADIFHNIPLQLERVQASGGSYQEILNDLRERMRNKGCESWLDNAIKDID